MRNKSFDQGNCRRKWLLSLPRRTRIVVQQQERGPNRLRLVYGFGIKGTSSPAPQLRLINCEALARPREPRVYEVFDDEWPMVARVVVRELLKQLGGRIRVYRDDDDMCWVIKCFPTMLYARFSIESGATFDSDAEQLGSVIVHEMLRRVKNSE